MVSWTEQKQNIDGTFYGEGFCLDDDTKPTAGIGNGSCLVAMDSGKVYCFDADSGDWAEFGSGGGGGD